MKNILIIGFGSIGKRHAHLFESLGAQVQIVTSQLINSFPSYFSIAKAFETKIPDIVIVSVETIRHLKVLDELIELNYQGVVCVEKPLAEKVFKFSHSFSNLVVLYNLRFSPLLKILKNRLASEKVISASIYCGQYLPDWRKDRDYRSTYSASKTQGGGVLLDLSHELDYLIWLLGEPTSLLAHGGKLSDLEIDSGDVYSLIGSTSKCKHFLLHLNYLDRVPRREISVQTKEHTYFVDLISGTLKCDAQILKSGELIKSTYEQQASNMLNFAFEEFCSEQEANQVLNLIERVESNAKLNVQGKLNV